jgi:hypothetical protein
VRHQRPSAILRDREIARGAARRSQKPMRYPAPRRFNALKTKYLYQPGDFNDLTE